MASQNVLNFKRLDLYSFVLLVCWFVDDDVIKLSRQHYKLHVCVIPDTIYFDGNTYTNGTLTKSFCTKLHPEASCLIIYLYLLIMLSYVGTWECLKFSTFCDCHCARNNEVDLHLLTINDFDFAFLEAIMATCTRWCWVVYWWSVLLRPKLS